MLKNLAYLLGLSTLLVLNSTAPLFAQPDSAPESQGGSGGTAPRTAGSGSRGPGSCDENHFESSEQQPALTAIVPKTGILSTQHDQVNLYFFIPPQTAQPALLEIVDQQAKTIVFAQEFELTTENTVARIVVPNTVQFLATAPSELRYKWTLQIYCETSSTTVDNEVLVTLSGWIHRLETNVALEVPAELWSDKLESWFAQRETDPDIWRQGLALEGLEQYANLEVQTYDLTRELEL
ncbi:MAG: DUF928 domain-containing protein [Cyanobacteria bacterium P01_G01_bin.54]